MEVGPLANDEIRWEFHFLGSGDIDHDFCVTGQSATLNDFYLLVDYIPPVVHGGQVIESGELIQVSEIPIQSGRLLSMLFPTRCSEGLSDNGPTPEYVPTRGSMFRYTFPHQVFSRFG